MDRLEDEDPHLLALSVEDGAVSAGRGAGGDQAHPPDSHSLRQLLLDDLHANDTALSIACEPCPKSSCEVTDCVSHF